MNRAYAALDIRAVEGSDGKRRFTGIASTPVTDRMGDVVEPQGAQFKLPLPLLWQHDSSQPIGWVTAARVSARGIEVEGEVADIAEDGPLKARLLEAWQMLKARLVRGLSIGFNSIESARIDGTYGLRFLKWEWLELSAVTIPANQDASITAIKSIDQQLRAALGREQRPGTRRDASPPGASGTQQRPASSGFSLSRKDTTVKTMTEQIAALEAARSAKQARMTEIMQKSMDEGRSTDEAESQEFDGLKAEVKRAEDDLVRLRELERMNIAAAKTVQTDPLEQARAAAEGRPTHIVVQRNLPKGTGFARYAMALMRAKGNRFEAAEIARHWTDTPEVARVLKAASDAGTTTDANWAAQLVDYQTMASEFVDLLRPMTIIGKFGTGNVPSLRRVPMNVRMATQTGGGLYQWVGEGAAKPVGELTIGEITLRWAKAAGIIVISEELARFSNPSAEAVVRNDMLKGMAAFSDAQFVNPDVGEVANVSPASVFNGVTPVTATGTSADALRDDLATLWTAFFTANNAPTTGVFIMSNRQAMRIGLMRNALGQKEFPDMTPMGGVLEGFPVIASEAVPDDSNGGMIGFVNADDIFFSDDGPVTIDVSREASLQMNTTPDEPTSASTVLVSLWQRNLVGLRAERFMNWKKRRSSAAGFIQGANYA